GGALGHERCPQQPRSPGTEMGCPLLALAPSQDRVEGGRTGRPAGNAQGVRQTCPIVTPPPLCHGRITPVPTQPGPTHQSQDCGQWVPLPWMTAEIRHCGPDLDERTRLCAHCGRSFIKAFWLV